MAAKKSVSGVVSSDGGGAEKPPDNVNGFPLQKKFEGEHTLVSELFEFVRRNALQSVHRFPISSTVSAEEREYAIKRMTASGWSIRVERDAMILSDPPRRSQR